MSTMKFLLKKDIKKTLPTFAMFIMAFFALCAMTGFGIVSNNGDFTVTALYVFYIVLIGVCVYVIFQGANLLRKNIRDDKYMSDVEAQDISAVKFVACKIFWTVITAEILYIVYVLGFSLMLVFADSKINDISKELGEKKFVPGGEVLLTAVSGLFIVAGVTAFVYLGYLLCYRFFLREKYAIYGSLSTTFCVFFVVWKLFDIIVPKSGIESSIGAIIYCIVEFAVCMLINLTICKKFIMNKGE